MDKISENDKKRIGSVMQSIYSEVSPKIEQLNKLSDNLENTLQKLSFRLMNHLKNVCSEEFSWIEKNSKPVTKDGVESVEINVEAQPFAEEYFKKWEKCTNSNDFGIKDVLLSMEEKSKNLEIENESCMNKCFNKISSFSDDQLKHCIISCVNSFINESNTSLSSSYGKIIELEKKI